MLVAVCEGEKDLKVTRCRLSIIHDYAPYAAFQRIDRDMREFIDSTRLTDFVRENGVHHITEPELYELVKFFDSDEDGRLSFQDFIQMVLPCEDNNLRNNVVGRQTHRVGRYDYLPRDIEVLLTAIVEKEIIL